MTARAAAAWSVRITDERKRVQADAALLADGDRDLRTDAVGELTIRLLDTTGALSSSAWLDDGDEILFAGTRYEFGGMTVKLGQVDQVTVRARSRLARRMRQTYATSSTQEVAAGAWIASRARAHGGSAFVQPSDARSEITQSSDQSELDVVSSLCSDLGWVWAEYGSRILAGQLWWWWSGDRLGKTWRVSRSTSGTNRWHTVDIDVSPDDRDNAAAGTITVPWEVGRGIGPLHRIHLTGAGRASGMYVVTSASLPLDSVSDVSLDLARPRRPVAKKSD